MCGDSHANSDALSKHYSSVSDECRSRARRVFYEVRPDEQNARGHVEAVSDRGTKSLLSSEERRCGKSTTLKISVNIGQPYSKRLVLCFRKWGHRGMSVTTIQILLLSSGSVRG